MILGVSPAYFFSRFTTDFSVRQIGSALPDLRRLGYEGFQLEVFKDEKLAEWLSDGNGLRRRAGDLGMRATQMVAHFLLHGFENEASLFSDYGFEEMKKVVEILGAFPDCKTVTVPVPSFTIDPRVPMTPDGYKRLWARLREKIGRLLETAEDGGLRMAMEVVPSSILGGIDGFLRMCAELGSETLGYNFDTGHAWSSKELISLVPARVAKRIYGTHLKDNFGAENLALAPGKGSIPWDAIIDALAAAGYEGAWDMEIACPADRVETEYQAAFDYLAHRIRRKPG
jgi:sugar phosphate isomerase/epimerase